MPESHPVPYLSCMGSLTDHGTIYSGRMYRIVLGAGEATVFESVSLSSFFGAELRSHRLGGLEEPKS